MAYWQARVDRRTWALECKATGVAVGSMGIFEDEVCFETRAGYRGRGFMTEALRAVARPGLVGRVLAGNAASRRVFEKCGFAGVAVGDVVVYRLNGLAGHDRGVTDFQAASAGGEHFAGVQAALGIE